MKLLITHLTVDDETWWQCELPSDEALWIGEGDTPIDAFNSYLNMVSELDQPNKGHIDYDWCKERGLIK